MKTIKTPIIPVRPKYIGEEDELDYKAICFFAATNFFLGDSTYFKGFKCLQPGMEYEVDNNKIVSGKKWFEWYYNPEDKPFDVVVEEFGELFDKISEEETKGRRVILPLSGGLDSRSQATVLQGNKEVLSYSYDFTGGVKEVKIARQVAAATGFEFMDFLIPKGYLWPKLEDVARWTDYGVDITSSRQAAVLDKLQGKGDVMFIGHWGDVLFDNMNVNDGLSDHDLIEVLKKKIVRKGGLNIAKKLWEVWGLNGNFEKEFDNKLLSLLSDIKIDNNNAKIRAFKSLYWAPRWTSPSLQVFSNYFPIELPYYDDRMCKFICSVDEKYLAARRIQIEYIKRKSPEVAKVAWQTYYPYNLYNYHNFDSLRNFVRRGAKKIHRIATGKKIVERNWELQFVGQENDKHLNEWLFENEKFKTLLPASVVKEFYEKFRNGYDVYDFHPVTTLLTLSVFAKHKL